MPTPKVVDGPSFARLLKVSTSLGIVLPKRLSNPLFLCDVFAWGRPACDIGSGGVMCDVADDVTVGRIIHDSPALMWNN